MDKDLTVIKSQQLPSGLTIAGSGDYDKIWVRDNVYVALALIEAGHISEAATIYSELYKIIGKYDHILDQKEYPQRDSELLHPRFTIHGDNVPGHWGNKEHDSVGVLLYGVGQLYAIDEKQISKPMRLLTQKLINYLETCRYWQDEDNGIWEEDPLLHSSSLAACIRGIDMVSSFCNFNKEGHSLAKINLDKLLPRESSLYAEDMALLSLIWPYGYKRADILANVETRLLRSKGVIRHVGDKYEANGKSEPEWVMGIPWLGIAHHELGNIQKAKEYLSRTEELYTENGLPESYLANNKACEHTPLAWSHAMAIVLRSKLRSLTG